MRFLFALVGLVALVVVGLWATGMLTLGGTPGQITAPTVTANLATVSLGTENKGVAVPVVTTTEKSIAVPTITLNKPTQPGNTTTPAQ
ncbi:MAG: hypothetical protein ABIS14_08965 [Sphingomonas sp.]